MLPAAAGIKAYYSWSQRRAREGRLLPLRVAAERGHISTAKSASLCKIHGQYVGPEQRRSCSITEAGDVLA